MFARAMQRRDVQPEDAERTRPGGPADDVLAAARREAVGRGEAAARADVTAPSPLAHDAPPRLVIIAGPARGAEFLIDEPVATIGRAKDCAVAIADRAISRRHCRIERRGARGWTLVEAGSGNGTRLNGSFVRRTRSVRDGDEIEIGDTRARFVGPGGVLVWNTSLARESPRASRRRALVCVTVAIAVLSLVAGRMHVRQQRPGERESARMQAAALRGPVDTEPAPDSDTAQAAVPSANIPPPHGGDAGGAPPR